jgi:hypothetical protein
MAPSRAQMKKASTPSEKPSPDVSRLEEDVPNIQHKIRKFLETVAEANPDVRLSQHLELYGIMMQTVGLDHLPQLVTVSGRIVGLHAALIDNERISKKITRELKLGNYKLWLGIKWMLGALASGCGERKKPDGEWCLP